MMKRVQRAVGRWRKRRDHHFAQRRMSAYLDGGLHERGCRRLVRHAQQCPECGPLLRGLLRLRALLARLGRATPGDATVVPLVLDRLRRERVDGVAHAQTGPEP